MGRELVNALKLLQQSGKLTPEELYKFNAKYCSFYDDRSGTTQATFPVIWDRGTMVVQHAYFQDGKAKLLVSGTSNAKVIDLADVAEPSQNRASLATKGEAEAFGRTGNQLSLTLMAGIKPGTLVLIRPMLQGVTDANIIESSRGYGGVEYSPAPMPLLIGTVAEYAGTHPTHATVEVHVRDTHIIKNVRVRIPMRAHMKFAPATDPATRKIMERLIGVAVSRLGTTPHSVVVDNDGKIDRTTAAAWFTRESAKITSDYQRAINDPALMGYVPEAKYGNRMFNDALDALDRAGQNNMRVGDTRAALQKVQDLLFTGQPVVLRPGALPVPAVQPQGSGTVGGGATAVQEAVLRTTIEQLTRQLTQERASTQWYKEQNAALRVQLAQAGTVVPGPGPMPTPTYPPTVVVGPAEQQISVLRMELSSAKTELSRLRETRGSSESDIAMQLMKVKALVRRIQAMQFKS